MVKTSHLVNILKKNDQMWHQKGTFGHFSISALKDYSAKAWLILLLMSCKRFSSNLITLRS